MHCSARLYQNDGLGPKPYSFSLLDKGHDTALAGLGSWVDLMDVFVGERAEIIPLKIPKNLFISLFG